MPTHLQTGREGEGHTHGSFEPKEERRSQMQHLWLDIRMPFLWRECVVGALMCERAESGRTMGIQMLEVHAEGIECNTSLDNVEQTKTLTRCSPGNGDLKYPVLWNTQFYEIPSFVKYPVLCSWTSEIPSFLKYPVSKYPVLRRHKTCPFANARFQVFFWNTRFHA